MHATPHLPETDTVASDGADMAGTAPPVLDTIHRPALLVLPGWDDDGQVQYEAMDHDWPPRAGSAGARTCPMPTGPRLSAPR